MEKTFEKALTFVLTLQGYRIPLSNANYALMQAGVTQEEYNDWRARSGLPSRHLCDMTAEELQAIYYKKYWKPGFCDLLPEKLATIHFQTAVQVGLNEAAKFLQRALFIPSDHVDMDNIAEAAKKLPENAVTSYYMAQREDYYKTLQRERFDALFAH